MTESPPDKIYLQDWPPSKSHDVTWCVDQINDDDIEYLKATPEREAAGEMRATCRLSLEWLRHFREFHSGSWANEPQVVSSLNAALAKTRVEGVEHA